MASDNDSEIAITIEGRGPTIVDALADVLTRAQEHLRAVESASEGGDDDHDA